MRLIVAMEQLREKNEKLYGKERISIGFWVGGNVTPNKFSEYNDSDQFKKKEFIRKLTKQIIKCPYCGKPITRDEYDINEKGKYVKIHCADDNCMFSLRKGRTIPVYLVDEEIYAKCPTVIISTVDKFARLPWSEQVGLLFGRIDIAVDVDILLLEKSMQEDIMQMSQRDWKGLKRLHVNHSILLS